MMKTHRSSRTRMLAGAAAILALGSLSLAIGSPGYAQQDSQAQTPAEPHADTPVTHQRREERIIIRTDHDGHATTETEHHGAAGAHTERHERVMIMTHDGDGDGDRGHGDAHAMVMHHDGDVHDMVIADCGGAQRDEVNEGTDNNRTRIVLCSRGDAGTPAARADRLAHVRDRIAGDSELSAEQKSRVLAAIDRQIARLRGQ